MSARLTIITVMKEVAAEQNKQLAVLDDNLVLAHCGLDSLCFAILVARLEDKLEIDPFTVSDEVYFPVTLGDLVAMYDNAA